jgi:hypothetical protein
MATLETGGMTHSLRVSVCSMLKRSVVPLKSWSILLRVGHGWFARNASGITHGY